MPVKPTVAIFPIFLRRPISTQYTNIGLVSTDVVRRDNLARGHAIIWRLKPPAQCGTCAWVIHQAGLCLYTHTGGGIHMFVYKKLAGIYRTGHEQGASVIQLTDIHIDGSS